VGSGTAFAASINCASSVIGYSDYNLVMVGPPGAGKSMLAQCLPSLLPPLDATAAAEISMIHSVAGQLAGGRAGTELTNSNAGGRETRRLFRNAAFLLTLRESDVQFVAADVPEAKARGEDLGEAR
jgi:predicted ATPase with chaperone activity